jgi:hypothetical protein
MIIKEGPNSVDLRISGPQAGTSDRRATVNVVVPGFSGAVETWIEKVDWEGFLEELRELERGRQGRAQLSADDPRDFQLTITATDRAGHMEVSGRLGRSDGSRRTSMEYGFMLDPGQLQDILRNAELSDVAV